MVQVGYRTLNFSEHNFRGNKKKTRWGSSTLRATIYLPYLPRICTRYTQVYYCRKALWFVATEGRSVLAAPVFSTKRRGCRTKNNKNYSGTHGKNYRPVMFRNHPCARHFACILSRLCLWKNWVLKQDRTPPRSRNALLYPPPRPPLSSSVQANTSRDRSSWDAARRSCDSLNTSRRFALGASDVCLACGKPDVPRPDIVGVHGSKLGLYD